MPVQLQLKHVLEAGAHSTRSASLNTSQGIELVDFIQDVDINIYVDTADLNNVFNSTEFASQYTGLSLGEVGDGRGYLDMISNVAQNISGQPLNFTFDWDELSAGSKTDLSNLQNNVWEPVGVEADDETEYQLFSTIVAGNTQSVPTILQLAGQGAPGKTASAFMGTVYNNQSAAILNMNAFKVPGLTVSGVLSDVLPTINLEPVRPYREELFIQAYNAYKYDLSYQRLSLSGGDEIAVPVRFTVAQEVNYDLCGSAIDGGHSNSMLTFVVEDGSASREYSVMKKESVSTTVNYMLHFVAVGAGPSPNA